MKAVITAISLTPAKLTPWKAKVDVCPQCRRPFGSLKQERLADGAIVHRNCWFAKQLYPEVLS
jgi:hypothetical protein